MARAGIKSGDEAPGEELGAEEPLAEWERELLVGETGGVAAAAESEPPAVDAVATEAPAPGEVGDGAVPSDTPNESTDEPQS